MLSRIREESENGQRSQVHKVHKVQNLYSSMKLVEESSDHSAGAHSWVFNVHYWHWLEPLLNKMPCIILHSVLCRKALQRRMCPLPDFFSEEACESCCAHCALDSNNLELPATMTSLEVHLSTRCSAAAEGFRDGQSPVQVAGEPLGVQSPGVSISQMIKRPSKSHLASVQ